MPEDTARLSRRLVDLTKASSTALSDDADVGMPDTVVCECFAKDGLQHKSAKLLAADKIELIDTFTAASFTRIEATSHSHPAHVPAFSDASEVLAAIRRGPGVFYKATCPNLRAVERAVADLDAGHGANALLGHRV